MLVFTWAKGAHQWGHRAKGVQVLRRQTQGDIQPCPIPGKSRVPLSTSSSWLKKTTWKHTGESTRKGALLKKGVCLFLRDTKPWEPSENNVFAAYFNLTFPCDHPEITTLEESVFPKIHQNPQVICKPWSVTLKHWSNFTHPWTPSVHVVYCTTWWIQHWTHRVGTLHRWIWGA